jgi:hypothetical protein
MAAQLVWNAQHYPEAVGPEKTGTPMRYAIAIENDPRFLKRIAKARASLRAGRGVPLEDVE